MDMSQVLEMLKGVSPVVGYVLMGLGALVVVAASYVKMTPNKDDDALFAKLENTPILGAVLKALVALSPIKRKDDI